MRIRNVLGEAIPNRPRSMNYFVNRAKQLRQLDAMFKQVSQLLSGKFPDWELDKVINSQFLDDAGNYTQKYPISMFDISELGRMFAAQYGPFDLAGLADTIDSFIRYKDTPGHNFFAYIPPALKSIDERLQESGLLQKLQHIPNYHMLVNLVKTDTDWALLNPEYHDPEEITQVENFLEAIRILNIAVPSYISVLDSLKEKVGAYADLRAGGYSYNPHQWRPPHGEVETLYHATAYVNEIVQSGFSVEPPAERRGVGNLGFQKTISFTHDLKIAMDIVRALKELTMIANGQLKARTIADWIRREKIPNFPWNEVMQVRSSSTQFGQPQYGPTTFDRFDIVQTAKLYEKYIWLSKIHPNPVFISIGDLVKTLVGRPPNDIGILACQVRLDASQSTYHAGESEFRVSADAVVSVKRII